MTKRSKIIIGICTAVLGVLFSLLLGIVGFFYFALPDFTDQEHLDDEILIRNFHQNRAEFEQLRTMLEHDEHIRRIDYNWTDPPNISDERVSEYRRMFAIVGTPRGIYNRRNPMRIEFIASARGWVTSGSVKGYEYRLEAPESLDAGLDKYHDGSGTYSQSSYRRIEGNWYLFFER